MDKLQSLSLTDEQNWRSTRYQLMEKLVYLLDTDTMSDIAFIVGPQKECIKAHQFMLSVASKKFDTLFNGMFDNPINVPNIEATAFRNMLKFIYTDKVELTLDSIEGTVYAARKYEVFSLEKYCVEFLKTHLNASNVFKVISVCRFFDIPELTKKCLKLIDIHIETFINSDNFTDIDCDTLEIILLRDTLMIKEIYLYEAILKWSKAKCEQNNLELNRENRLSVLKNCAKLIRYPLMTSKEFADGPANRELLTDAEIVVCSRFLMGSEKEMPQFSIKPRSQICEIICNRFESKFNANIPHRFDTNGFSFASNPSSSSGNFGTNSVFGAVPSNSFVFSNSNSFCSVNFIVSDSVFIIGFGLYNCNYVPIKSTTSTFNTTSTTKLALTMNLYRLDASSKDLLTSQTEIIQSNTNPRPYPIKFKFPVQVTPNILHRVDVSVQGSQQTDPTLTGIIAKETMICKVPDGDDITFTFKPLSPATSLNINNISQIIFYA